MHTPSRILHVAHGIPSYHNSLLELAKRLQESGIELTTVSHNDLSRVLHPAGHSFHLLIDDDALENERAKAMTECREKPVGLRWICQYKQARHYFKRSLESEEFESLVLTYRPDLLLIDMECHRNIIQAHKLALPVVLLSRWYSVFRHDNAPPMHTQQLPAKSFQDSMRIRLSWMKLMVFKRYLTWRHQLSRQRFRPITYASSARPTLAALARARNLPLSSFTDTTQWLIPHVYSRLPVMSLTLDCMEFEDAKDHRMHYVGAMVGAESRHHPGYTDSLSQLKRFIAKRERIANPLVFCSLSTFWDTHGDTLQSVIELFNERTDLDLVVGLGGRLAPQHWPRTGSNVLLLDYAPQLSVLRHASLAITHGGVSTINEAIVHGVPLLVVSSGHVDQPGCAARVIYHGIGVSCDARSLNTHALTRGIEQILGKPGDAIRSNLFRMQSAQRQCDAQCAAVEFLREQAD